MKNSFGFVDERKWRCIDESSFSITSLLSSSRELELGLCVVVCAFFVSIIVI